MKRTPEPKHSYKVGDILVAQWGYTMRLVDFYQVIRTTSTKVELRMLKRRVTDKSGRTAKNSDGQQGYLVPKPWQYDTDYDGPYSVRPGQLCRVRPDGVVCVPDYPGSRAHNRARPWDGRPTWFDTCD